MATRKAADTGTKKTESSAPVKAVAPKPASGTSTRKAPAKVAISKPAAKAPAKKTTPAEPAVKKQKTKVKVVRDSFTMPQDEYQKISEIKEACLEAGLSVKKSEVLRAGLKALSGLSPLQLKKALAGLEKIKTGRPKKH